MAPIILSAPAPPLARRHLQSNGEHPTNDENSFTSSPHSVSRDENGAYRYSHMPNGANGIESDGELDVDEYHDLEDYDESEEEEEEDELDEDEPPLVHIEVRLRPESRLLPSLIEVNIPPLLRSLNGHLSSGSAIDPEIWEPVGVLGANVERIFIAECERCADGDDSSVDPAEAAYAVHVYRASEIDTEDIAGGLEEDEDESRTAAATIRELPSLEFEGLWDNLIYPGDIKSKLLTYLHSTTLFAENEVDFNVISWNRLVLLYGPPGTGKTSLCRALSQKLLVRMSEKYTHGRLVEINSHSLFSKWFSESGKLVQKLFDTVNALIEDEACFVVVMIDEVESLTAARAGAMSGSEPSDALRVVNALLTQLDKLKSRKNVLVMTTSNLAGSIDPAFVDRADIKQYVGLPPAQAIYWILASCLSELSRADLAPGAEHLLTWHEVERLRRANGNPCKPSSSSHHATQSQTKRQLRATLASQHLYAIAQRCYDLELSGRFLRKVPLMAHARYLASTAGGRARVEKWIDALERAIDDEKVAREQIDLAEGKRPVK